MTADPPFSPSDVLLLGPGPSPVPSIVSRALAAPTLGHLDPEFLTLMDRVRDGLRAVIGTSARFTLPLSATGSAGMEAAFVNLVEPGDRVVVGVHGVFGQRMCEVASRQGADVVRVDAEFGAALDPAAMTAAIAAGPTRVVAFVHAETSTGVLQPTEEIVAAAKAAGALVIADCVTSLAGVPVEMDARGFDAVYSGTQKCLSVPPGLAPFALSEQALERIAARRRPPTSWYLDVDLLAGYWNEGATRAYHHTAPVNMVYALAAGLDEVFREGLEQRYRRHADVAAIFYRALEALGLHCLVPAELRTPMLTSVVVPEDVDEAAVRRRLRAEHGIEIGGGLGPLAGRVWRVGLMGHGARVRCVRRLALALADCLAAAGRPVDLGAVAAAVEGGG